MSDCVFCKILSGDLPGTFVFKDETCSAFLDIHPINPGHVLVVPNRHVNNVVELTTEEAAHLLKIGRQILISIKKTKLQCEGVNLFISDGAAAGQAVPHTHLHIVPRFFKDGQKIGFKHSNMSRERLEAIAKQIQDGITK